MLSGRKPLNACLPDCTKSIFLSTAPGNKFLDEFLSTHCITCVLNSRRHVAKRNAPKHNLSMSLPLHDDSTEKFDFRFEEHLYYLRQVEKVKSDEALMTIPSGVQKRKGRKMHTRSNLQIILNDFVYEQSRCMDTQCCTRRRNRPDSENGLSPRAQAPTDKQEHLQESLIKPRRNSLRCKNVSCPFCDEVKHACTYACVVMFQQMGTSRHRH